MKPQGASIPTRVSGAFGTTQPSCTAGGGERDDAVAAMVGIASFEWKHHPEIGAFAHRVGEDAAIHVGVSARLEHDGLPQVIGIAFSHARRSTIRLPAPGENRL